VGSEIEVLILMIQKRERTEGEKTCKEKNKIKKFKKKWRNQCEKNKQTLKNHEKIMITIIVWSFLLFFFFLNQLQIVARKMFFFFFFSHPSRGRKEPGLLALGISRFEFEDLGTTRLPPQGKSQLDLE